MLWIQRIPILRRFFEKHTITSAGRWNLQYGQSVDFKANMSNEDHCGTCGQYALLKQKENIPALQPRNIHTVNHRSES